MNDTIIKGSETPQRSVTESQSSKHPEAISQVWGCLFDAFCSLSLSPAAVFFWLLPYLLITHWPFRCQTLLSPVANFRCYYPSSACNVARSSTSKNTGQENMWLSTICSHRQPVVHPSSLSVDSSIFTHCNPLAQRKEEGWCRCRIKKKKKKGKHGWVIWCNPEHVNHEIKIVGIWNLWNFYKPWVSWDSSVLPRSHLWCSWG